MSEFLKIVAICILAAVGYGIIHDQITARVCIEYFTIGHPRLFPTESPTLLGLGWGIVATWWVGAILGIGLASCARLGSMPQLSTADVVPGLLKVLVAMTIIAPLAGVAGYYAARSGGMRLVEPLASLVPEDRHVAFIADLWAHMASYGCGFIGGTFVCSFTVQRRRRLQTERNSVK